MTQSADELGESTLTATEIETSKHSLNQSLYMKRMCHGNKDFSFYEEDPLLEPNDQPSDDDSSSSSSESDTDSKLVSLKLLLCEYIKPYSD